MPYYISEYNQYLKPFVTENKTGKYLLGENYRKELSQALTNFKMKMNINEMLPYLKDEETGLYDYAGTPSPISLENQIYVNYAAHQGSRYFTKEGFYRLPAGQDVGANGGSKDLPVRNIINGTILISPIPQGKLVSSVELTIEQGDGYAIRYRHMPLDSYSKFKSGDSVSTNDIVGRVGSYSSTSSNGFDAHLHFEILKGTPVYEIVNGVQKQKINKTTGKLEYKYDTSLDPSKVVIEGGTIREKK